MGQYRDFTARQSSTTTEQNDEKPDTHRSSTSTTKQNMRIYRRKMTYKHAGFFNKDKGHIPKQSLNPRQPCLTPKIHIQTNSITWGSHGNLRHSK